MTLVTNYRKTRITQSIGLRSEQPDAMDVLEGTLYFVTDELNLERSNGITWESYSVVFVLGILPIENGGTNSGVSLSGSSIMVSDGSAIVQGDPGSATTVLHGNASGVPIYNPVVEDDISLSNVTTNNSSVTQHGFLPTLSGNPLQFLDGNGNYSTPAAGVANSYSLTSFTGQTSVNVVHNFGAYPVVQVIDNTGAVIIPLTIVNNTLNDFTVTFSLSTTGTIIASVGSPQPQGYVAVSGTYTTLTTDYFIKATSSPSTITLITAVGNAGRIQIIDNAAGANIRVDTTGAETIEGEDFQDIPPNSAMAVYSDGVNWRIF